MSQEGQIVRNKRTGEMGIVRGGVVVPYNQQGQSGGGVFIADPTASFDLPMTEAELRSKQGSEARAVRGEAREIDQTGFDNATKFRNEFRGLPSVSEYNIALGTYNSAMSTGPTSEGDQSLITAFARMMDPNSVVREGEFATAAGNENAFQQLKTTIAKQFGASGAGRLTEAGRQRLREEMRNLVVNRFQAPYERDRQQYQRFAQMEGIDPYMVVGEPAEASFPANLLDPPSVEEAQQVATNGVKADTLPQEYQDAHYAYLQQNWGNLDPEKYSAFRAGLDQRYDQTPDPSAYASFAGRANQAAQEGQSPADLGAVPSANRDMGMIEGAFSKGYTPTGAFFANAGNALGAGLPASLSGNQDRLQDIRAINPGSSFAGEVVGGIGGTVGLGAGLNAAARGTALASPLAADLLYGGTYGAAQDTENPYRGALLGAGAATLGAGAGRAIGGAFPQTFNRAGVRAADESVPSVEDLQGRASELYQRAEATGATASPEQVDDIVGRSARILRDEGMLTPRDRIVGGGDINNAMRMLDDFSGMPMTPTQVGSVRKTIGEGRTAMKEGKPDYNQRRVARQMLDEFDAWAEPALPNIGEARATAQRAILGREMGDAIEMATGPRAAQFTQSGEENALRSVFRGLDTAEVRGRNSYPKELTSAIQNVSRGDRLSNAMRTLGKFAPNSAVSAIPALGASGVGASTFGPMGAAAGLAVAGGGLFGRRAATSMTQRAAREAELTALGGPEYKALLDQAREVARERARGLGVAFTVPATSAATR